MSSVAIQIVTNGQHIALVYTLWSQYGGGNVLGWKSLEAGLAPGEKLTELSPLQAISDQFLGTSDATGGFPLNMVSRSGGANSSYGGLPADTEFIGSVAQGNQIWDKLVTAAMLINGMRAPYFLGSENCQTAVAFMNKVAGLPTILPTDDNFNMIFAPGVYFPLGLWSSNPLTQSTYFIAGFAKASVQYTKDNALHWSKDGWLYDSIEAGFNGPNGTLAGPNNTVPVGGASKSLIQAILQAASQGINGSSAYTAPVAGSLVMPTGVAASLNAFASAISSQLSFLRGLSTNAATLEAIQPGETDLNSIVAGINNGDTAEAVANLNLLLDPSQQLMALMGQPQGGALLDGSGGNLLLVGFGGGNTLIAGSNDELFGGGGANTFLFGTAAAEGSPSVVLDYDQEGGAPLAPVTYVTPSEDDTIDLADLLSSVFAGGSGPPVGMLVRAIEDNSGSFASLQVDPTGDGTSWQTITQLYGLHTGDEVSVVLDRASAPTAIFVQPTSPASGAPFATALVGSQSEIAVGQTMTFDMIMSQPVTVTAGSGGGLPYLYLSDGAFALYDTIQSNPLAGTLVFDHTPGDSTSDVQVDGIFANGTYATVESNGTLADFSAMLGADTGVQTGPAFVASVTPVNYNDIPSSGWMVTGETFDVLLSMSTGMVVNTGSGTPALILNDGGSAAYDSALSDPSTGILAFEYAAAASDSTKALGITGVSLNGGTIADPNGIEPNFTAASGALNFAALGEINSATIEVNTPVVVGVTASAVEVTAGDTATIALTMNEPVVVNLGTALPSLGLSDGEIATYDTTLSDPSAGTLVFDYQAGTGFASPDLAIASVTLAGGTAVQDLAGHNADFGSATDQVTGMQVGAVSVIGVDTSVIGNAAIGEAVTLTVTMSGPVTLDPAGGLPSLALSNGGTATYDPVASDPSDGVLEFDYLPGSSDKTPNLTIMQFDLASGTTLTDANGSDVNVQSAASLATGLSIDSPLTVTGVDPSVSGTVISAGQTITIALPMSETAHVDSTDGSPSLILNDGGTATYSGIFAFSGTIDFRYVVQSTDQASNLAIAAVVLNGASITDSQGFNADFSAALNVGLGIAVDATAPVLASIDPEVSYTVNASPMPIAPALALTDPGGTITSAAIAVTDGTFPGDGDVLSADAAGTNIGVSYDAADEILVLSGTSSIADYQKVLRTVGFATAGSDPTSSGTDTSRSLLWQVYDGSMFSGEVTSNVDLSIACFAAGSHIATERGDLAVEALRIGERVVTLLGAHAAPVVWIGRRRVACARHPRPELVWPVRIAAGAFGSGRPIRDLWLSPDHAIYLDGVLVPAKHLANDMTIAQISVEAVTYYHIELEHHDVLLAEGLPVESYLNTGDRANFENGSSPIILCPDFASREWEAAACAPLVVSGPLLEKMRHSVRTFVRHGRQVESQSTQDRLCA